MKTIKCENCGKQLYFILARFIKIDNKIYELCPKCAKLVDNFKIKNSIK